MSTKEAKEAIDRYVKHKMAPGSFIKAILDNDLMAAVSHGDEESLANLPEIARYVFNRIPGSAWGSKEAVLRHLAAK